MEYRGTITLQPVVSTADSTDQVSRTKTYSEQISSAIHLRADAIAMQRHGCSGHKSRHALQSFDAYHHRLLGRQRLDADVAEAGLAHPANAVRSGEVEATVACEQHLQA
jgi:hypothetical protein